MSEEEKIPALYGINPWQTMTKAQLVCEVEKLYFALQAAHSVLMVTRVGRKTDPYFGPTGSAGRALLMADEVFAPYVEKHEGPEFYYGYFRYAKSLHFQTCKDESWLTCPVCNITVQSTEYADTVKLAGQPCEMTAKCTGVYEWLTWANFKSPSARIFGKR